MKTRELISALQQCVQQKPEVADVELRVDAEVMLYGYPGRMGTKDEILECEWGVFGGEPAVVITVKVKREIKVTGGGGGGPGRQGSAGGPGSREPRSSVLWWKLMLMFVGAFVAGIGCGVAGAVLWGLRIW